MELTGQTNNSMGIPFLTENSEQAEQPIVVQLMGDFRGFYAFLLALENQPRIMRIRTINMEKKDKCPPGHISAEFEMSIFFERNRKERSWPQRPPT